MGENQDGYPMIELYRSHFKTLIHHFGIEVNEKKKKRSQSDKLQTGILFYLFLVMTFQTEIFQGMFCTIIFIDRVSFM